jgi:DNA polymerase bacteriophage-type
MIWVDFETRSACDLKTAGVYNYAQSLSTEVLCMAYAYDDGEVQMWTGGPLPDFTGHQIRAHNAAFERLIFWYVLQQDYPLEQFYCTAAQARANCAPGSLEDAGRFAGASMRKDHRGGHLVRQCCIPPYNQTLLPELFEYCAQDVRAMRAISKGMRGLSDDELLDYHVNERINDRGVLVDVELARSAVRYASAELVEIQDTVAKVTQGAVTSVRSPRMRQWVQDRVSPEQLNLMTVEDKISIDKTVRANLLACDDLDPDVREVVQSADDLWASSVAKFARMAALADEEDHRVRGAFVFNGGAATGRLSSYGLQVHNFTRKCASSPQEVRDSMVADAPIVPAFGKRVTDVLKSMLRPALIPAPGKQFVVADWSGIEARCNPWLSGTGEDVLDVFRSGRDIYVTAAASIFKCTEAEVTPDCRAIGKVSVLACGYGGGVGAFAAMGRAYGVHLPEAAAKRTVDAWRRANQWAVRYWQALESAYMRAMRNPNQEFAAGRVFYLFDGVHLWYALPSGRVLCYPYARFETDGVSYAKCAWKPAQGATEWPRARLWSGLAAENICQAVANDLLRHSLRQVDDVVLTVHDEILLECPIDQIDAAKENLKRIMCTPPDWCKELPLAVDIKAMNRYGK